MALCTACPVSTLRVVGAGEGAEHGKGAVVLPLGGGRWGVHWSPRHNAEGRGCWGLYLQLCTHPGSTPPPTPSLPPISSSLCPPSHRISLSLSLPLSYPPPPHHQPAASTPTLKARRSAVVVFVGGHLLRVRVSELHVTAGGFNTSYIRERLVCTGTRLGHAFFGDLRWAWRSIKGPMALCFSLLHYAFSLDKTTPPSFNCLKTAFIFVDTLSVCYTICLTFE